MLGIKKIWVMTLKKPKVPDITRTIGYARVELDNGLFLDGMRIYPDQNNMSGIFLSFPVRRDKGQDYKTYYPVTNEARDELTTAISEEYFRKLGE